MNRNVGGGNQQQGANQQQQQGANQQQQQQAAGGAPRGMGSRIMNSFYWCADTVVDDKPCYRNFVAGVLLSGLTAVGACLGMFFFPDYPKYVTGIFGAAWGSIVGGAIIGCCYYGKNKAISRRQRIAANNLPALPVQAVGVGGNVQGSGQAAPGAGAPGGIGNGRIQGPQMPQGGGPGGPAGGGNVPGPGQASLGISIPGGGQGQVPSNDSRPDLLRGNVQRVDGRGPFLFIPIGGPSPSSNLDITNGTSQSSQDIRGSNPEEGGESPREGPSGVQHPRSSSPESNQCFLMGDSDDSFCCSSSSSLLSASDENSCCIAIEPSSSPVQPRGSIVSIVSSRSSSSSSSQSSRNPWRKHCSENQGGTSQNNGACCIEMQVLMSNQGSSEEIGPQEEEEVDTSSSSSSSQVNIPLLAGASQGATRTNEEQHSDSEEEEEDDDDSQSPTSTTESSEGCMLLSSVKEAMLFIPGYTQEGQLSSLVSLQGLVLNMSEQVLSGLKMLALKTYIHMRNTKNVHQYQYTAFSMGRKTSMYPSSYATTYQQELFQSLLATKIFAFSDTSMSNLEYKVGFGQVGISTPLASTTHVGLTFNHTKGTSKDGIGVQVGTAFGSSKSKAETKGFSAIMVWNPESNGFTGHLASSYSWGKAKNTRYVTYAGKEVCSKGTPDIHLVGGLAQLGYNVYIGRTICVTPYLEYVVSNVLSNRYIEGRGPLPCKISTNKEKRWEQILGLRSRWEMTSTAHLQTWIATVIGSSHTQSLSSIPVMAPSALYESSVPTQRKRYRKIELGLSYESNITEVFNVSLNSKIYIGNTKHTDGQYVELQMQFQY